MEIYYCLGRVFGAMFTKLGVPIPTQIGPKVLAQARDLCQKRVDHAMARLLHMPYVDVFLNIFRILTPGAIVSESVNNQEAHFYRILMEPHFREHGGQFYTTTNKNKLDTGP